MRESYFQRGSGILPMDHTPSVTLALWRLVGGRARDSVTGRAFLADGGFGESNRL